MKIGASSRYLLPVQLAPQASRIEEFREALSKLIQAEQGATGSVYTTNGESSTTSATANSGGSLLLSTSSTAATFTSAEEVNTTPTSYSTTEPTFGGASSSSPSLGGVYDGSSGDTTLTFTVTVGGIVGLGTTELEVRDTEGTLVDTASISGSGTVATLSNGLEERRARDGRRHDPGDRPGE